MEEQTKEIEFRFEDFWDTFKRCWIVMLVALIVVAVGLYILLSAIHTDRYEAKVTIYILRNFEQGEGGDNYSMVQSISIANALIDDCKVLMVSRDQVLNPVLAETPSLVGTDWEDLKDMIKIENNGENRIITLSVTTGDSEMSAELANKVATHACEYFNEKYQQPIASVVDFAEVPQEICNPVSKMLVLLVAMGVAILIYLIHFVVYLMDDKINSAEDVEKYLGMSMLGMIPNRNDSVRRKSKYGYYYYRSSSYYGSSEQGNRPAEKR
ncbi:MAG: hypothetical protein IJX28_08635 [Clostridia bacterium]|nr:hypothetical protein [Clostridia bacterium]